MKAGLLRVAVLCEMTNCNIVFKDNGNGSTLFSGTALDAAKSRYAACGFEAISTSGGALELWLPRDDD